MFGFKPLWPGPPPIGASKRVSGGGTAQTMAPRQASKKPNAPHHTQAVSIGAGLCDYGACSARTNGPHKNSSRPSHRAAWGPIDGICCGNTGDRSEQSRHSPPLRCKPVSKGTALGAGPPVTGVARGATRLGASTPKIPRRKNVRRMPRSET